MKQGLGSPLTFVIFAELEATSLPNPHSTATKKVRLLLKEGMIILQPLPFGQVRGRGERSDELRRRGYWISALIANTSTRNVATTNFATISNARLPITLRLALLVADVVHVHGTGGCRRSHEGRHCCFNELDP